MKIYPRYLNVKASDLKASFAVKFVKSKMYEDFRKNIKARQ